MAVFNTSLNGWTWSI